MKITTARKTRNLRAFRDNLKAMQKKRVLVGIPKDKNSRPGDQIGNAEIGFINEFGSPAQRIPPRPFLNPGAKDAIEKGGLAYLKQATKEAMANPEAAQNALKKLGTLAQSTVKSRIVKQVGFAPPAASTLAARKRKNFMGTKSLIVTGSLVNSIRWVIVDGTA